MKSLLSFLFVFCFFLGGDCFALFLFLFFVFLFFVGGGLLFVCFGVVGFFVCFFVFFFVFFCFLGFFFFFFLAFIYSEAPDSL